MEKAQIVGITIGRCDSIQEVADPDGIQFANFKPSPHWRYYPRHLIAADEEAYLWFSPLSGKIELLACDDMDSKVVWRSTVVKLMNAIASKHWPD